MKKQRYSKSRLHEKLNSFKKVAFGALGVILASTLMLSVLAKENNDTTEETLIIESIPIIEEQPEELKVEIIEETVTEYKTTLVTSTNESYNTQEEEECIETNEEGTHGIEETNEEDTHEIAETEEEESNSDLIYIRCTVYCDTGYTSSGAWTESGCLAGKREWLGKTCKLYKVNSDSSVGDCIGTFTFQDTGFGLDELDGTEYPSGTIKSGASIDMWHATEEECWDWVGKYGDYVYLEFLD